MTTKRANNLVFSLAAILSLFVSAVSACACSHHQPQAKAEEPSCHSSSHGGPQVETPEPGHDETFGPGCGCFVNSPVPAITAKSESKKPLGGKIAAAATPPSDSVQLRRDPEARASLPDLALPTYDPRSLSAGPSRAPPRL